MRSGYKIRRYTWETSAPHKVSYEFCIATDYHRAQSNAGIFKQAADIGIAMFALVCALHHVEHVYSFTPNQIIAIHTFCVLFLRWQSRPYVLWLTLVSAWSAMGAIVLAGPTLADTTKYGPFCTSLGF
jgi:hypothetical protein